MTPKFFIVLQKELLEALRDRRAMAMIALFVVLYPALLWFVIHKIIANASEVENEGVHIAVIGGHQIPGLLARLELHNVTASPQPAMNEAQITALLKQGAYAAVLRVPERFSEDYQAMRPAPLEVWNDSSNDKQRTKLQRFERQLRGYGNEIASARLLAHGVSSTILSPMMVQTYDTASSASRSASLVGAMLGMFFAATFFFGMNTAMDSTAGERERRSLEVLLAQPARPIEILCGKWGATASLAVLGLTLELLAVHTVLSWMPLEEIGMSWRTTLPTMLAICLISIPLCLFAAAFEIALAMNAKSLKEAQATMSFALLVPLLPAIVVPMLNLTSAAWMYAVPVLANQTLMLELAKGQNPGWLAWVLTGGTSLLLAFLAISFANWRMKSEQYVLGV